MTDAAAAAEPASPEPATAEATCPPPARGPARRLPRGAGLVGAGIVATVLAAVAATLWVGHQRAGGPILPVSWCRMGSGPAPLSAARLFGSWQLDSVALIAMAPFVALYAWGVARVRRRHPGRPWPRLRTASMLASVAVIVIATCGPVGVYDQTLFSMHMFQHLMLIMIAPPLAVASRPMTLLLHATRNPVHTWAKRALRSWPVSLLLAPPVALGTYAATIVGLHLSSAMDTFMKNAWLGQVEHLIYFVVGYQFFVLLVGDEPIRWRLSMPGRLALLVLSMGVDTFTGLVLLQTNTPIAMKPHSWGSSPLLDTQTGGGIMWAMGDGIMVILIVLLFRVWVRKPEAVRRRRLGWLESVRRTTFETHTQHAPAVATASAAAGSARPGRGARAVDIDDDEASYQAYNEWLARLHGQPSRPG
jgi:putative copper resistance protein D